MENVKSLARLQALGCEEVQGYHFAKPMAADAFARYMSEGTRGIA